MGRRRLMAAALAMATMTGLTTGLVAATAAPITAAPITVPGGLSPQAAAADDPIGCAAAKDPCTLKPSSLQGTTCDARKPSQKSPPTTITVLVTGGTTSAPTYTIKSVDFTTYLEDVLPNEWLASWDPDALKAGAIAVKSYAWYWVNHFGGYINGDPSQCFDVTDDQNFQVYEAGTATKRTNDAIAATHAYVAREGGQVYQASYQKTLTGSRKEACGAGASATGYTVLSQYGSQACNEVGATPTTNGDQYKFNVILAKYYGPSLQLATSRQLRTAHDFTFSQTSTPAVFDAGTWRIDDGYPTVLRFGRSTDIPTVTTTGDGFARIGVWRPSTGTWYQASPSGGDAFKIKYGRTHDIPVQAQYSGDDKPTVLAVYRPSTGTWYLRGSSKPVRFGRTTDIPVPGHYFGTAKNHYADTIAVYRPSTATWYFPGHTTRQYGRKGDIPVPADYDGNGTTDIAVYRPSTNVFYVHGHSGVHWGRKGDVPVTGDFTGDGKADLAVYRPSNHTWYVRGGPTIHLGGSGDKLIGAAPYHD